MKRNYIEENFKQITVPFGNFLYFNIIYIYYILNYFLYIINIIYIFN